MKYLIIVILFFSPLFSQNSFDLSYDIGKELVLLQTDGAIMWYDGKDRNPDLGHLPPFGYRAIYWNPKSNEYFLAYGEDKYYNLRITNGLTYKLDSKKQETNYTDREIDYLQYLGSLDFNTRVYLGKDGNQYIKKLKKINDKIIVYPIVGQGIPFYTNSQGEKFGRHLGRDTWTNYGKGELEPF